MKSLIKIGFLILIGLKFAFCQTNMPGIIWAGSSGWHHLQPAPTSSFTNPATLIDTSSKIMIGFTASDFFENMFSYIVAGMTNSSEDFGWGITISGLTGDDIPQTRLPKPDIEPSSENRPFVERWESHGLTLVSIGASIPISSKIDAGLSLSGKYVWIESLRGYGAGANFSTIWRVNDFISVGSSIENIDGLFCSWSDGVNELTPPNFSLSAQIKQHPETRTDFCATLKLGISSKGEFIKPLAVLSTELSGVIIGAGYRSEGPGIFIETPIKSWSLAFSGIYHSSLGTSFIISIGRKL